MSLEIARIEVVHENFFFKPLKNFDTILVVLNYAISKLFFLYVLWLLCIFLDNGSYFFILCALFLFQKSDSSLSDFLSDDDVNSSKKVTKTETLKKADPMNPQKDSNAFDEGQKVTEIKPR